MIHRVLVPMDESEMAKRALAFSIEAYPKAAITVLHVVGEPSPFLAQATGIVLEEDIDAAARERARRVFERAEAIAEEHDATIETTYALGNPSKAIVKRAAEYDVVVIGSHGGSLQSRILMGDVARKVSRRSPVPVTVVR